MCHYLLVTQKEGSFVVTEGKEKNFRSHVYTYCSVRLVSPQ